MKSKKKTVKKAKSSKKRRTKIKPTVADQSASAPLTEKVVLLKDVSFTDEELDRMGAFGTGVLLPKLTNRFMVEFLDETLRQIPGTEDLTKQMVRVAESSANGSYLKKLELLLEDDLDNKAINALEALKNRTFTIAVKYLSGDEEVLRTHYIKSARFVDTRYSALDYSLSVAATFTVVVSYSTVAVV